MCISNNIECIKENCENLGKKITTKNGSVTSQENVVTMY